MSSQLIEEVIQRLSLPDANEQLEALLVAEQILTAARADGVFPPESVDELKRTLVAFSLSPDVDRDVAASTVWVLGKAFDETLVDFFIGMLRKARATDNSPMLFQALLALDNVGAIRLPDGIMNIQDAKRNEGIADDYLNSGAKHS